MNRFKPILEQLERTLSALEKPVISRRELVVEELIAVFAVRVWLGALTLLP